MTKSELVEKLVDRAIPRSMAMDVVEKTISIMAETLSNGESIYFRGLGTFKVREVAPKVARNISKGTVIEVPAHKTVKLILGNQIKNALK